MDARFDMAYFLVICRALCAKVVGATSSEGVLVSIVLLERTWSMLNVGEENVGVSCTLDS